MKVFEHSFRVQPSDVDELGHASNVAYVRWIQDAAVAHSTAVGLDWAAYQRIGSVFVVHRHEVDYLRPARAGEALVARTWVADTSGAKSLRRTEICRAGEGALMARGATTWVFIDIETGRPKRIPPDFMSSFG
jgi:acyl-CoA thioester hydrolase